MGGHAWYWSYSNTDVSHNYPETRSPRQPGLFVSNAWGYNEVDMTNPPHELSRPRAAIEAIRADRIDGESLIEDATIADSTLSICTGSFPRLSQLLVIPEGGGQPDGMDGIEYGTLWEDVGYNLGEDPVADTSSVWRLP